MRQRLSHCLSLIQVCYRGLRPWPLLTAVPDNLLLLPARKLETYLADLQSQTASTSALLTYLLQTRDALQQDSETYNKLIGELVGEAQKIKTGKRVAGRRGSAMA